MQHCSYLPRTSLQSSLCQLPINSPPRTSTAASLPSTRTTVQCSRLPTHRSCRYAEAQLTSWSHTSCVSCTKFPMLACIDGQSSAVPSEGAGLASATRSWPGAIRYAGALLGLCSSSVSLPVPLSVELY